MATPVAEPTAVPPGPPTPEGGKYVYCIIRPDRPRDFGQGTTFSVWLPARTEPVLDGEPPARAQRAAIGIGDGSSAFEPRGGQGRRTTSGPTNVVADG